jgi:hypothetical protein
MLVDKKVVDFVDVMAVDIDVTDQYIGGLVGVYKNVDNLRAYMLKQQDARVKTRGALVQTDEHEQAPAWIHGFKSKRSTDKNSRTDRALELSKKAGSPPTK